jgi:hypothetical protein
MLVYFFIYTVRVRGWSFGFGRVFGSLGKVMDQVKRLFQRNTQEDTKKKSPE